MTQWQNAHQGGHYNWFPGGYDFNYPNLGQQYSTQILLQYGGVLRQRYSLTQLLDDQLVTDDMLKAHPLFTWPTTVEGWNPVNSPELALQYRNALLAYCIPETSFSAGANPIINDNYNYQDRDMETMRIGWWRPPANGEKVWDHGDFRDVALYFVQNVFHQIVADGNLKQGE